MKQNIFLKEVKSNIDQVLEKSKDSHLILFYVLIQITWYLMGSMANLPSWPTWFKILKARIDSNLLMQGNWCCLTSPTRHLIGSSHHHHQQKQEWEKTETIFGRESFTL